MKPRRWLGYEVSINDLLPEANEILNRFEESDIPISDIFGSNSENPTKPTKFILLIGPAVELERLNELLDLLNGIGPDYINPNPDNMHRKKIYIGSYETPGDLVVALSEKLKRDLKTYHFSPSELTSFLSNLDQN